jgi:hypothetical protein
VEGRPQYATRRDANQAEIKAGLELLGFVVFDVSQLAALGFDLLVCGYHGKMYRPTWLAVEVKTAEGVLTTREEEVQAEMIRRFGLQAPITVARTVEDVVSWFGRLWG